MSGARDVALNLLAALLGALLLALWRRVHVRLRYRASRAFWLPLLRPPCHIVLAEFHSDTIHNFELAGLTGLGEFYSVVRMISEFSGSQLPTNLPLSTEGQSSPEMLTENLIILGGPDVNAFALKMMNASIASVAIVRNQQDKNIVVDLDSGVEYGPSVSSATVSGKDVDVIRDYGLIIRTKNPFNARREVLIISGAYGYGVIAGMQVCLEEASLLQDFLSRNSEGLECIVSYSITDSPPGLANIELIRPLRAPAAPPSNG
jgi:hypothetical protein